MPMMPAVTDVSKEASDFTIEELVFNKYSKYNKTLELLEKYSNKLDEFLDPSKLKEKPKFKER